MERRKVAIIFYGLTRSLRKIHSILKHTIFDELTKKGFDYDIFIHTYKLNNPYINPWSKEVVYDYDNKAYQILNPKYFIIENQHTVERNLNLNSYYSRLGNWKNGASSPAMCKYLIRNMVLALHSKKMVTSLFEKHKNDYDYAIITRPDQVLYSKIQPSVFSMLNDTNIVIPHEHSYSGCNDRFCIAKPDVAIKYGKALDNLKEYSTKQSIHSETYMKDYIESLNLNIIYSSLKTSLIRC